MQIKQYLVLPLICNIPLKMTAATLKILKIEEKYLLFSLRFIFV